MSPEDFANKMQEIQNSDMDCETMHITMDKLLLDVLLELGYDKGCEIFENTYKWYA